MDLLFYTLFALVEPVVEMHMKVINLLVERIHVGFNRIHVGFDGW
jgi:hypothetical protein